jgi:tetratricopeptide (TPR) repeat protein
LALRDKAYSHRSRGEQELARDLLDQAIAAYEEALRLDERLAQAHTNLGLVLAERGQPDRGIAACRKAIDLEPEFACYYHNLGRALMMKGDDEAAIGPLKESTRLEPIHGMHYVDLALALQKERRFEEARDAFVGALKITPNHPGLCNALAWLLATCPQAELRDPARAIKLARKAMELAPKSGNSWSTLGAAEYRLGNSKEAVAALDKSIEMRSGGHGFDYFFLAMAHREMGNDGKAREAYDRAVRWMDENAPDDENLRRLRAEAERLLHTGS